MKLNIILTLFSLCLVSFSFSQKRKDLKTVKIDGIKITKQNLKQTSFRNGHKIKLALSLEEWKKYSEDKIPAYCYIDFMESNEEYYNNLGCFYNWYAVHDKRGLAPKGFHIPCIEEMNHLLEFLSPDNCGMEIKSDFEEGWFGPWDEIWDYELPDEMGFNSTGLSILPNENTKTDGSKANFWIFNPENTQSWHVRDCKVNKDKDDKGYAAFRIDHNQSKSSMFSIRLIKD